MTEWVRNGLVALGAATSVAIAAAPATAQTTCDTPGPETIRTTIEISAPAGRIDLHADTVVGFAGPSPDLQTLVLTEPGTSEYEAALECVSSALGFPLDPSAIDEVVATEVESRLVLSASGSAHSSYDWILGPWEARVDEAGPGDSDLTLELSSDIPRGAVTDVSVATSLEMRKMSPLVTSVGDGVWRWSQPSMFPPLEVAVSLPWYSRIQASIPTEIERAVSTFFLFLPLLTFPLLLFVRRNAIAESGCLDRAARTRWTMSAVATALVPLALVPYVFGVGSEVRAWVPVAAFALLCLLAPAKTLALAGGLGLLAALFAAPPGVAEALGVQPQTLLTFTAILMAATTLTGIAAHVTGLVWPAYDLSRSWWLSILVASSAVSVAIVMEWVAAWSARGAGANALLWYFPVAFGYQVALGWLPLIVLGILVFLLRRSAEAEGGLFPSTVPVWLCGLGFAWLFVDLNVPVLGFPVPLGLPLAYLAFRALVRSATGEDEAAAVAAANPGLPSDPPLVLTKRGQLLRRGIRIAEGMRKEDSLFAAFQGGTLEYEDYAKKSLETTSTIARVRRGVTDAPDAVALPPGQDPRWVAFGTGACSSWGENMALAVRYGVYLATMPVAYAAVVALQDAGSGSEMEALAVLSDLLRETAFWIVVAAVFGAMLTRLPRPRPSTKALVVGVAFFGVHGLLTLARWAVGGISPGPWLFRPLEVLLFLLVLAIIVEVRTLRAHDVYWRHLPDYYGGSRARGLISYAFPLAATVAALLQQVLSGDAAAALGKFFGSIPNIPGGPGG